MRQTGDVIQRLSLSLSLTLTGGLVLVGPLGVSAQNGASPSWLTPCVVSTDVPALCGTYEVWEDRAARDGRRIPLNVVVVTARGDDPLPDPVLFFRGGPGAAATEAIAGVVRVLEGVRDRRDVVFIDQRGTGASNPLDCEGSGGNGGLQAHFGEFLPEAYVRDCLAHQDADVSLYTTPIAVDDFDEVRAALGYGQINLYGGSYGTRAAQVYLRRHPGTVRAAVLKGVAPMDMMNPLPFAKALEHGVQAVIAACAAEAACQEAYPDLAGDWEGSQARFEGGAVAAEVIDPETGRRESVTIDRGVYADGVRHILYSVAASAQLPGMIHAAGRGDFDAFAQRELGQSIGFAELLSMGMFMTVTCSEDLRFVTEDDIREATEGTFLGDYRVRRQLAACEIWGWGEGVGEHYQGPVTEDVPVLLISGEFDTATPADGAEEVARHLPNGRHLIFPNESHDFANPQCEWRIMTEFISRASLEGVDLSCVPETVRPPFDTTVGRERT